MGRASTFLTGEGSSSSRQYSRPRQSWQDFLREATAAAGPTAAAAQQFQQAIEGAAPPGLGVGIPGFVKQGLEYGMKGGQTPAEYLSERAKVTGGFQRALGGLAAGTARRGFYAPQSVAGAAMGRPARGLAAGLSDLAARRGQLVRSAREKATQTAAGLYQFPWQERKAQQEAMGERFKGLYGMRGFFPGEYRGGRRAMYLG